MARTVDRTPPTVGITSPVNNTSYTTNTTITVNVNANDSGTGVSRINIYMTAPGGTRTLIHTASFSARKSQIRTTSTTYLIGSTLGVYNLEAEAIDAAGNRSGQIYTLTRTNSTTSTTTTIAPPPPPPTLPSSWILQAPTAWNQGSEGSCGSCATACMLSVTYYYHTGATSYSQSTNIFSPEYLYNKHRQNSFNQNGCIQGDCASGSTGISNANYAKIGGCPLWSVLPYSTYPQGCQTNGAVELDFCGVTTSTGNGSPCHFCNLTPTVETAAGNYKITEFGIGYATDLYTLKRLIRNGHGLSIGGNVSTNHNTAGGGDCNYVLTGPGTSTGSAHAWCIIGYDDAKQAVLMQNSWGPNFGCNGRIWVSYNYLASSFSYYTWVTYRVDKNPYPIL